MKITKVNIPRSRIGNGLDSVTMFGMNRIVLIAGKNGSGKSRLLSLIAENLTNKPVYNPEKEETLQELERGLKSTDDELDKFKEPAKSPELQGLHPNVLRAKSDDLKTRRRNITIQIDRIKSTMPEYWPYVETDETLAFDPAAPKAPKYEAIFLIPTGNKLTDYNALRVKAFKSATAQLKIPGTHFLAQNTIACLQSIQDRCYSILGSTTEQQKATAEFEALQGLIRKFFGVELERTKDGDAALFGFPLAEAKLSDGQQALLQMCAIFHCQKGQLDDKILFLDEPENHLHPSVIIDVIDTFHDLTPNGQIWIATHSIEVLSYYGLTNIWYMDEGKVSFAGPIPEKVTAALVGEDERVARLQNFISHPAELAMNRHAYECLFDPPAVETPKDDKQIVQIRESLLPYLDDPNHFRVLDFGAGKARIFKNIIEDWGCGAVGSGAPVEYVAYERDPENFAHCRDVLTQSLGDAGTDRVFQDSSHIFTHFNDSSFDVAIMCNVLHEIPPGDWVTLFSDNCDLARLLKANGRLLIVENEIPAQGEKAHQGGYIVLGTPELKSLFGVEGEENGITPIEHATDKRLKAHWIEGRLLANVKKETRRKALEHLHERAEKRIYEIRDKAEVDYRDGREHAFWVQQFANSRLALRKLG